MPLFVALLARAMLGDPLTFRKILGILVGTGGVAVIFADSFRFGGELAAWGMAAVVLSAFLASLCSVVVKQRAAEVDPLALVLASEAVGAAVLLGLSGAIEGWPPLRWNLATVGSILYLGVFGSVVAFALYYWIIKHIDVTLLSYQTLIIPVLALLLGWIFLGETLSARVALGGLLVLAGIGLEAIQPGGGHGDG
jgi:drug/metabolite transporter (DMT)-like permease